MLKIKWSETKFPKSKTKSFNWNQTSNRKKWNNKRDILMSKNKLKLWIVISKKDWSFLEKDKYNLWASSVKENENFNQKTLTNLD